MTTLKLGSKFRSIPMHADPVAIWQLAADEAEYGDDAGKFILVTPDGEEEIQYASAENIFDSEDDAREFAEACGLYVVPLCVE